MNNLNDTPMEESDSLKDVVSLRERLAAAIEVISGLDESWPHVRGALECRFCHVTASHHHADCKAKFILGA